MLLLLLQITGLWNRVNIHHHAGIMVRLVVSAVLPAIAADVILL
jgi:hypothetical protein